MFKFIHAADIHLDSPLLGLERYDGAPVDEIRGATRKALGNLVELAIEQSVAFVLIAGDLYDGDWKEFRTGLYFVKQMARLNEAGIRVFLIAGNHDAANKMTRRLPLPANVRVFSDKKPDREVLDAWDVVIHGQSFARGAVLENLVSSYPKADSSLFNIGLLHTSATGCEGHEPYAPCSLDDLRTKQYDYWALGHIHKRDVLYDDPPIVFCGNLQGRNIRETGPKGCTLVTVDGGRARAEPRSLDVLRWEWCRVDADGAATAEDVLDRVRKRLGDLVRHADSRPLAVRVQVDGPCVAHRTITAEPDRWANEVRAAAHDVGGEVWIEKVVVGTSLPAAEFDLSQWADGPLGELVQYIAELRTSPEGLAALGGELADFCDKLPAELLEGPTALGLNRPETLRSMLDQVEQLLIHQLVSREGTK